MNEGLERVKVLLISDRPNRRSLLMDAFQRGSIVADVKTLQPGQGAVRQACRCGPSRYIALPHFVLFDFTHPAAKTIDALKAIAFAKNRSTAPVLILTSPESLPMIDSGKLDGGKAIMPSPTGFNLLPHKLRMTNRAKYFKALRIFYEYGPILIRAPQALLDQDRREQRLMA